MQTTLSVSLCVLFFAAASACSSEPTGSKGGGGNGSVINGTGGTAANNSAGTSTSSAGSAGSVVGGASSGTVGGASPGTAGTGGTSTAAQECLNTPITCVDSETITGCNPDTLMNETLNCKELIESQGPGLKAEGCAMVDGRSVCSYDFDDTACRDGAAAFAVCYEAATNEQVDPLNFYFDCFTDFMYDLADEGQPEMLVGAHTLIPCFTKYISGNTIDCATAEEGCFPAAPGDGAGGAGP